MRGSKGTKERMYSDRFKKKKGKLRRAEERWSDKNHESPKKS